MMMPADLCGFNRDIVECKAEVARLLALTYYLPLFNSQPLNKNHAANLIAEFLLTRPLRDVTSSDLIEILWNVISTHTSLAGRDVG